MAARRRRVALAGEQGIALTVAMCSLALMITLGGIALNQAVNALGHSTEQTHVKRALQAADAAIDAAAYGLSRVDVGATMKIDPRNPSAGLAQNCLVTNGEAGGLDVQALDQLAPPDANGNHWCPEATATGTTDGATYTYRISQLARAGSTPCGSGGIIDLDRDVVGVGRSGGEVRRVKAHLTASLALLSGAAVQSSSTVPLSLSGSARVLGDAQSNGDIVGTGLNVIGGDAIPGPGHTVSGGVIPAGSNSPACKEFTLPDVEPGAVTALSNDNAARTDKCINLTTFLAAICLPGNGVTYDAATRTLTVEGNGWTMLTGTNYMFCHVRVKGNGILAVSSATAYTRIFLDDPDKCRATPSGPLFTGAGTINVDGSGRVVNCHSETQPETLQIYAVGNTSPTLNTTQTFAPPSALSLARRQLVCGLAVPSVAGEPMTIVAPHSNVSLSGTAAISGQVAGYSVSMSGLAAVNPINALVNLNRLGAAPVLPLYQATDYIECTGNDFNQLPASSPAQGC